MGLNTLPCSVDVAIACWPWGAYLGDDAATKGVRMKISSWTRHDHNTMPPASKTTGNYVNSSLAKVEALKAGYDEAIMLNPQGLVSECTGENIFVARHGKLITPAAVSSGALEGITQYTVHAIADDLGFEVVVGDLARSDLYVAEEMFVCGTAAEVSAVNSVDDRPIPCPGPMTAAIAEEYAKVVRGEVPRYKDWVELCMTTGADPGERQRRSTSSTRRCGTAPSSRASRSRSTTSCASPSSSTTSACAGSRAATRRPTPRTQEFFRRAPSELALGTADLVAFGSTRKPAGKTDSDPTLRALVEAGTSTACIVGKSWDFHVTEALGTTLDEGVAMVGDSVRVPARPPGCGCSSTPSTASTATRPTPSSCYRVLEAAAIEGAECLVLCDTNGGSLPHEVAAITAEIVATSATTSRSASTPRTTRAARWPTPSPPWSAAPPTSRARSTATASARATPT